MPASHLIACHFDRLRPGMARSYGCPAISFTDTWLIQQIRKTSRYETNPIPR